MANSKHSPVSKFTFEIDYAVWFGNVTLLVTMGVIIGVELNPKLGSSFVGLGLALLAWAMFWFFYLTNSIGKAVINDRDNRIDKIHVFPGFLFIILLTKMGLIMWTLNDLIHFKTH